MRLSPTANIQITNDSLMSILLQFIQDNVTRQIDINAINDSHASRSRDMNYSFVPILRSDGYFDYQISAQ